LIACGTSRGCAATIADIESRKTINSVFIKFVLFVYFVGK
jgi:hypothetical protein